MASIDFAAVALPLSEADPCGPDLDMEGDPAFMNFLAKAEGLLPASYFSFERSSIDFDGELRAAGKLLDDTRDLRLLVVVAKLMILNRDLGGFAGAVTAMASLLEDHWDAVHPRPDDGDASLRLAVLGTLDDGAPVVLPLQYAPLTDSRRAGAISYRTQMVASGEIAAREGEAGLDATALEAALAEADLPRMIASRDHAKALRDALAIMHAASIEHAGYEQALTFARLGPLVDKMLAFLDGAVAKRDPAASLGLGGDQAGGPATAPGASAAPGGAPAPGGPAPAAIPTAPLPAGAVSSLGEAAAALDGVLAYFRRREPSSPAILLIRQARQLMGRSFMEAIQMLVPSFADQAIIRVGGKQVFELSVERLAALEGDGADAEARPDDSALAPRSVGSRPEAIALLDQVRAFYRATEPTSPVPLLIERARTFAEQDFMSLLKDVLPEGGLKSTEGQGW